MKKLFVIAGFLTFSITVLAQTRASSYQSIEERLNEEYCSGLFKTIDGTYIDLMDDRVYASTLGYINILDWLQGRVAGLQVYKMQDNSSIPYIRNQRAAVFIDEIQVSSDWINVLPVTDIAMIKIIKGPFIGSWRGTGGGAIVIYTIRGGDGEEEE